MHSILRVTLLLGAMLVIVTNVSNVDCTPIASRVAITFYEHTNFTGRPSTFGFNTEECTPLMFGFSSVKIPMGSCFKFYTGETCRGENVILRSDCHSFINLGINQQSKINDRLMSSRKCNRNENVHAVQASCA